MENNAEILLELRHTIDAAKTKLNRLEGEKESRMETLKKDFNCNNLKQAEKKREELENEIAELEEEIETGLEKLQEDYPQLFEEEE